MPRLYANPFVKDAPMTHIVHRGEWRYVGPTYWIGGSGTTYSRDVTYSDGAVRWESETR